MKKIGRKLLKWLYPVARFYWFIFRPSGRGVKVVLKHGDEILLVQHSYGTKGLWMLPGGGIKNGETPEEAAVRESKEEVGLDIKNLKNYGNIFHTGEYKKITLWVLSAEVESKDFKLDDFEIKDARWFHKERLPFVLSEVSLRCFEMVK